MCLKNHLMRAKKLLAIFAYELKRLHRFSSLTGGSVCLPGSERSGQTALPGERRRSLEFQKARGPLRRLNPPSFPMGKRKPITKFDDLSRTNPTSEFVVRILVCEGVKVKEFLLVVRQGGSWFELSCGSKIYL